MGNWLRPRLDKLSLAQRSELEPEFDPNFGYGFGIFSFRSNLDQPEYLFRSGIHMKKRVGSIHILINPRNLNFFSYLSLINFNILTFGSGSGGCYVTQTSPANHDCSFRNSNEGRGRPPRMKQAKEQACRNDGSISK